MIYHCRNHNLCPICKQNILKDSTMLVLMKRFYLQVMAVPEAFINGKEGTLIKEVCEEIVDITEYFKKNNEESFDLFLCGYFEKLVEIMSKWKNTFPNKKWPQQAITR